LTGCSLTSAIDPKLTTSSTGQRMFIDPIQGLKLIDTYLNQ